MLALMKFMEVLEKMVFSQKIHHMILVLHILLQKPHLIILSEHMVKHMDFIYNFKLFKQLWRKSISEKLIPLFINNIISNKSLPVYGNGDYTRDWLYVKDHAIAIDLLFHEGKTFNTYNIGGFNEWKNINLIKLLCSIMDKKLERKIGSSEKLITFIKDRPGHDKRYAIDASKIKNELGWVPSVTFEEGLLKTINWYLNNEEWLKNITSGAYLEYYKQQYK